MFRCNRTKGARFVGFGIGLVLASSALATGKKYNGKAEKGTKSCTTQWELDTGNRNRVFLSWQCAKDLELGTINQHGTPGDESDDTFDPTAANTPMESTPGGYSYWVFSGVKVCVKDDDNRECCLTVDVNVVKDRTNPNKIIIACGLISAGWLKDVKWCCKNADKTLTAKWNGSDEWDLVPPKKESQNKQDSQSGSVKPVLPGEVQGDGPPRIVDFVFSSLSAWTIIPRSIAVEAGIIPTGTIDISGTSTLRGLYSANMNSTGQTIFDVAPLSRLNNGIAPDMNGIVLISEDANSDFGVLGGTFMSGFAYGHNSESGNDVLASDALPPAVPTVSGWGLVVLALLFLTAMSINSTRVAKMECAR